MTRHGATLTNIRGERKVQSRRNNSQQCLEQWKLFPNQAINISIKNKVMDHIEKIAKS